MAFVQFDQAGKVYRSGDVSVNALHDVSFEIEKGEICVIVGQSGAGKTTLLNILGGMDTLTSGRVLLDGEDISKFARRRLVTYRREQIGFVFQFYNLIPNLTAVENVEIATQLSKNPLPARQVLEDVGLGGRMDNFPAQLSGGEQQRVAIARALVKMPRVLLLDEPLSNLDARLRLQTREEIRRIQKETGITTVFVTHDQEEAMSISDMIVVMKLGVVQQIGKPQEVYDDPANLFVANFLGTPPINVFSGRVEGGKLFIGDDCVLTVGGLEDQEVTVGVRPEGFILDENGPLTCCLSNVEVMGRDVSVVSTHAASLKPSVRSIIDADDRSGLNGEVVRYSVKPHKLFVFHKETEQRLAFEVK